LLTSSPTPEAIVTALATSRAATMMRHVASTLTFHWGSAAEVAEPSSERFADMFTKDASDAVFPIFAPLDAPSLRMLLVCYVLFAAVWSVSVIHTTTWTAIAAASSHWFFFRTTDALEERPYLGMPVLNALGTVLRYHMGSIALGALILPAVLWLQAVYEIIEAQTKKLDEGSSFRRMVVGSTRCCMWCFEACIKFVSGYAFVYVAMSGETFSDASKATFHLLLAYPTQVELNRLVQGLLFALQSLLIPTLCAFAAYWLAHQVETNGGVPSSLLRGALDTTTALIDRMAPPLLLEVNAAAYDTTSPNAEGATLYVALVAFFLAYTTSRSVASVYECAVDSTFVCAIRDQLECNSSHMSDDLRAALSLTSEAAVPGAPRRADHTVGKEQEREALLHMA